MRRPAVRQPRRWRVRHLGVIVCDTDRAVEALAYVVDADSLEYTVTLQRNNCSPVVIWPRAEQLPIGVR